MNKNLISTADIADMLGLGREGYIIGRWGMSRVLPDLPAVESFISRATGVNP